MTTPRTGQTTSPLQLLDAAFDQALGLIDTVEPDDYQLPTACTEFDVAALVSHIVFAGQRIADLGHDKPFDMQADAMAHMDPSEWRAALCDAQASAAEGWAEPGKLDREFALPWGTFAGALVVGAYLMELVTHAWDLADALGRTHELDSTLAEAAFPVATLMLPPEPRGGDIPFAPVVAVPADAPAPDRLAGYVGRRSVRATAAA